MSSYFRDTTLADSDDEAAHTPTAADLAAVAERLESVLAQGEPVQTKALLRILIAELRVNSKTCIQPTYRIVTPGVCATSGKVETVGIEPTQGSRRKERLSDPPSPAW
jgi:hypothetical protein